VSDHDERLDELADLVLSLAGGEYQARGEPSLRRDRVDALTVGLNLLAETLQQERMARENAETLLHDSLHAYEHAPAMFCSLDAESLKIVKCNATFAAALALQKPQLLGRRLVELVPSEERELLTVALRGVRIGETLSKSDFSLLAADGPLRPVLLSASVALEDGQAERLRVVLRDVSHERSLEAQLRQAQKMDAIGRLASGIAHDFNNILTVVLGSAEVIRRDLGPTHETTEEAEIILEASERAAGLTRQLLAFGRADLAHFEVHDVNRLIEGARRMLERPLEGRATFELRLHSSSLPVRLDATQLTQVLLNLVFNARDAMDSLGHITIATDTTTNRADGERVIVSITDDGAGMSEDVLEHACEPFFTTKASSHGTGLGLAVCYGILRKAGGTLELTSRLGEGTTVRLDFPMARREQASTRQDVPMTTPSGAGRRALVVDDTDGVRRLMAATLADAGYEVLEASDAVSALALYADGGSVDILVTDVVMPGASGPELAHQIWEHEPDLPTLFVSGYTGERLGDALLARRGVAFLQKPFRSPDLERLVHQLLATRPISDVP
jgi:two-component system, cell cycle sensor histidine kinase and response regulator CckA